MAHVGEKTPQGLDKVNRYNWKMSNSPGELVWLPKSILNIDHRYQRAPKHVSKINQIAKNWNWVSLAAIVVAQRPDKTYWVVDGQHRVIAAMQRSDVDQLPCLVHQMNNVSHEAEAFIDTNTGRKPVQFIEKHKAAIMSGDAVAAAVQKLIDDGGKRICATSSVPNGIKSIGLLSKLVTSSNEELQRVWPLVCNITDGKYCSERIIDALVYIEKKMPGNQSITDTKWASRLMDIGNEELMRAAGEGAAFFSKGGAKAWAVGIVNRLNKGLHNKLELLP